MGDIQVEKDSSALVICDCCTSTKYSLVNQVLQGNCFICMRAVFLILKYLNKNELCSSSCKKASTKWNVEISKYDII